MGATSRIVSALALVAACGGGHKGAVGPAAHAVCVDLAAPGGAAVTLARDDQPGLVADGDDRGVGAAVGADRVVYAVVEDGGAAIAVTAAAACGERACEPEVVRVEDGAVVARAPLAGGAEIEAGSDYPFAVQWLALEDGDGDGAPEVWVAYDIVSPPEPAVGSTTAEHVAVLAPGDLGVRLDATYASYPEASSLERCDGALAVVDADCDGASDLVLTESCAFAFCFEIYDTGESADGEDHSAECGTGPQVTGKAYLRQADGRFVASAAP